MRPIASRLLLCGLAGCAARVGQCAGHHTGWLAALLSGVRVVGGVNSMKKFARVSGIASCCIALVAPDLALSTMTLSTLSHLLAAMLSKEALAMQAVRAQLDTLATYTRGVEWLQATSTNLLAVINRLHQLRPGDTTSDMVAQVAELVRKVEGLTYEPQSEELTAEVMEVIVGLTRRLEPMPAWAGASQLMERLLVVVHRLDGREDEPSAQEEDQPHTEEDRSAPSQQVAGDGPAASEGAQQNDDEASTHDHLHAGRSAVAAAASDGAVGSALLTEGGQYNESEAGGTRSATATTTGSAASSAAVLGTESGTTATSGTTPAAGTSATAGGEVGRRATGAYGAGLRAPPAARRQLSSPHSSVAPWLQPQHARRTPAESAGQRSDSLDSGAQHQGLEDAGDGAARSPELAAAPAVGEAPACAICLGPYTSPARAACGHVFCSACLRGWVPKSSSCPKCKQYIGRTLRIYL